MEEHDQRPGGHDAPLERQEEAEAQRGPGHEDPERLRDRSGLDDARRDTQPERGPAPDE